MHRTAVHCIALQCTASHCSALHRTAVHCIALQHTVYSNNGALYSTDIPTKKPSIPPLFQPLYQKRPIFRSGPYSTSHPALMPLLQPFIPAFYSTSIQTTEQSILPQFQQETPLFHLYSSPSINRYPYSKKAPILPPIQPSCLYSSPSFQPSILPLLYLYSTSILT